MKILCLTPWFPCHRQEQNGNFILDSFEALADLGHEIIVLVSEPWRPQLAKLIQDRWKKKRIDIREFSEKLTVQTCRHFSIPRHYAHSISVLAYRNKISSALVSLAKKHGCQLIHAHTEIAGVAAIDAGHRIGIPTIVTLHGIDTDKKLYVGITRKLLFDNMLKNADRIVLVGESLRPFFKKFVSCDDHFRIVHNGFRLTSQKIPANNTAWPENLRFISVSNLHEGKGIDLNLRAFAQLNEKGIKNWTYKIVGDGPERKKLEKLVNTLNLQTQIFFLGACQHNDVYKHLTDADIFCLPSYREAFGIAYIEAMSLGLLAIGIAGQGPTAFIEHQKTGLLVSPKSDSLATVFAEIFASREKMINIAKAGEKHVWNHFTWHHHAANLDVIYRELLQ